MFLTLDIGNTNTTIGGYKGKKLRFVPWMATDRFRMEDQHAIELYGILDIYGVKMMDVTGAIIGLAMPPAATYTIRAIRKLTKIESVVAEERTVTGLDVRLNPPGALGADLVAGCVAAAELYGGPCIIWDMGTTTTASVIDSNDSMLDGCIIPGAGISIEALASRMAQLPVISMEAPDKVVGTNTVDCMRSGLTYRQASMVDGMRDRIEEELRVKCKVVATGGLLRDIAPYCRHEIIHNCNLLLEGLRMLYEKNLLI